MKKISLLTIVLVLGFTCTISYAAGGMIGCGGVVFGGSGDYVTYGMRNFNDAKTINIDRIVVYDTGGTVLCDYPVTDSFPTGFRQSLAPHQITGLSSFDMVSCANGASVLGGLQTVIYWSFSSKGSGLPLSASFFMANTNAIEQQRWSPAACETLQ